MGNRTVDVLLHCSFDMALELYRDKHHACLMFTDLIEEDGQAVQANSS